MNESPDPLPERVLGVFAHPDDPEFFAGGTFAKFAAAGSAVAFVVATSGDKGSSDPEMNSARLAAIREAEETAAASALGVPQVCFLRYPDGALQVSLELREALTRVIRKLRPELVITCDPQVFYRDGGSLNHPDHRAIGEATLDAVYPTARDRLNYPQHEQEGLAPHKVRHLYIAGSPNPNFRVDVSDHIDTQVKALAEHRSQISDIQRLDEMIRDRTRDAENGRHYEYFHRVVMRQ
ncbi:MAG: PIG-L family deacetylase [Anaerolineaceae bacterium]|nr:PIG-L family deacetylase [Anaerolineaceae bacterium]